MTARAERGPGAHLLEAARTVVALGLVLVVAAAALSAADAVPGWLTGQPRDVRRARTVDEAERRLRARLVLPSFFPSSLAWPPDRVRFVLGPPGAAALTVKDRAGNPHLLIAETVAPGPIPEQLVPEAQLLDRARVEIGPGQGTLARVVEDGVVCWQLTWEQGGRSLLLRSRGSADELLRMARSAREVP